MPMLLPRLIALFCAGAASLAAVPAQAPDPIARAEPGAWRLRPVGGGQPMALCVGDPHQLLQIHHKGPACPRIALDGAGNKATVRYACAGAGYGQTSVTVETRQLVRIRTQGVDRGAPFDEEYEARRVGACGA